MEIYLIPILFIFSTFISFLRAIIVYAPSLQQSDIMEISINSNQTKLHEIKLHIDLFEKSMFLLEYFLLFILSFNIGIYLNNLSLNFSITMLIFIFIICISYISIKIINSVGIRFSLNLVNSLITIAYFIYKFINPFINLINIIENNISGQRQEEASREDIQELMDTAREEGTIEVEEYKILKNIMKFNEILISDVMTPRTVVFSCNKDSKLTDVIKMPELQMFSRIPLRKGDSLDDGIEGYVMTRDILNAALAGRSDRKLSDYKRKLLFIPGNVELGVALEKFLSLKQHLFIVVDEYGGVEGLLTMEDVVESMLGEEIVDEADKFVDLRELAKYRRDKRISTISIPNELS